MGNEAKKMGTDVGESGRPSITELFGENVFSIRTMRNYLSEKAYASLTSTICDGCPLDPSIADEVADAMKTWAEGKDFLSLLKADNEVTAVIPDSELEKLFDYSYYLRFINDIFKRIGLD